MNSKQYGHYEQGVDSEFFSVHMNQMTAEKLCSKSDIAAELAYRDQRIAELEAKVQELEQQISALQAAACKYIKIEADMENFDGDKRGMLEHFTEAKTKLTALLPLPPHQR